MITTDRYYPCNDKCIVKKKYPQLHKCSFERKSMCPIYKICEGLTELECGNDGEWIDSVVQDVFTDVLRTHGYIGEIRKTKIVNI